MKCLILICLLVVAGTVESLLEEDKVLFQSFKLTHGKTYKNQAEETKRFAIFKENLRTITIHNDEFSKGIHKYKQGINEFTDLTPTEFRALLGLQKNTKPVLNSTRVFALPKEVSVPDSIDWREFNVVTDIKNQGSCGSTWAFSVVGSTESAFAISSGVLVSLSEQQLVDCSTNMNNGFSYIQSYGLESESDYPTSGCDGVCHYNASNVVTKITSCISVPPDEEYLRQAVGSAGPVSLAIDANYLQFYATGIFDNVNCDPNVLNHAVLAVGYGSENRKDFWIIKNSWGVNWGENGYFRLLRGRNMCGVKEYAAYPII